MKPDSIINRNSNELWGYKKNMTSDCKLQSSDNRRMYASGYRFSGTQDKLQNEKPMSLSQNWSLNASDNQGSLKESMTRKKITAFKVSSKNSQDGNISKPQSINSHKAPKPNSISSIKRSSSTIGKSSSNVPALQSRKHLSESSKRK